MRKNDNLACLCVCVPISIWEQGEKNLPKCYGISSSRIFMERKLKDKPNEKNHCYNNFNLSCTLQNSMNDFKKAPPYPTMFLTAVKVGNEYVNSLHLGILKDFGQPAMCQRRWQLFYLVLIQWYIHSDGKPVQPNLHNTL